MSASSNGKRIVVVGAGPGGYAAAFHAADLGLDVTLIEKRPKPGGVCLYEGCIPSKTLLHAARLIHEAREATAWGIDFGEPRIDLDTLRKYAGQVVTKLTGGLGALSKQRKVNFIQGSASFDDAHHVTVTGTSGETQTVEFDDAIIATGSRIATIPIAPVSPRVMDSASALQIPDIPGSLLIVGGGYIGLEMGCVYSALGSEVTVVEMLPSLLPGADEDLVEHLSKRLRSEFKNIVTSTKVVEMTDTGSGIAVKLTGVDVEPDQTFDKALIAVGRKPNSDGIGLENVGVELDKKGFVTVDRVRRTNVPNLFAIGDVAGEPMLAHKASHEGRVAVQTIADQPAAFEPYAIPAVVFTDPELAWCGYTESAAKAEGIPHRIASYPWAASGRATTLDRNDGLTKLVIDPHSERVLGVGIVGVNAGEMLAEGVLAIEMGAVVSDLAMSIHPHPTLSETIMEAADVFFGHSAHYKPRR